MTVRYPKTATEIRREAAALAREYAREHLRDGDPEGAGVMRDLTQAIARIKLTRPYK